MSRMSGLPCGRKWKIQEQVFACTYQSSAAVLYIEVSCGELKLSDPGLLKRVLIERNMVFSKALHLFDLA